MSISNTSFIDNENPYLHLTALRISGDPLKIYFHKVVRFSRLMDGAQRRPVSGWQYAEPMEQARSVCSIAQLRGKRIDTTEL